MASDTTRPVSARSKLIVNSVLGISFVAISAPQATRIPAHEWISLAFIVVFALHLLFSWQWIVGVTLRLFSALRGQVRLNYLLDAVSYLAMVAAIVSGIIISESAFPALGFPHVRDRFWAVIHLRSSELLLILIGAHLALHWNWLVAALGRLMRGDLGRAVASERRGSWTLPVVTLVAISLLVTVAALGIGRSSFADRLRPMARGGAAASVASGNQEGAERGAVEGRGERERGASVGETAGEARQGIDGERGERREKKRPRRGEGGGNQPGWRQRYLRPAINIATFMGVPFLVTLVIAKIAGRARPQGGRTAPTDPLQQGID